MNYVHKFGEWWQDIKPKTSNRQGDQTAENRQISNVSESDLPSTRKTTLEDMGAKSSTLLLNAEEEENQANERLLQFNNLALQEHSFESNALVKGWNRDTGTVLSFFDDAKGMSLVAPRLPKVSTAVTQMGKPGMPNSHMMHLGGVFSESHGNSAVSTLDITCHSKSQTAQIKRSGKDSLSIAQSQWMDPGRGTASPLSSRARRFGLPKSQAFLGELEFEFVYSFEKNSFVVHLMRGENIGGSRKDYNMSIHVKLSLMPGSIQMQSSQEKKCTQYHLFDETFSFSELPFQRLQSMSLRLRVCNNISIEPGDYFGEVNVKLDQFNLLTMARMWSTIKPKLSLRELGHIFISLNLNTEQKQVIVAIGRATNLIYHPITGAPNPYVSIEVSQEYGNVVKKRTKAKHKTTFPDFRISMTFDLASVTPNDVKLTTVIVKVMSDGGVNQDTVLGVVTFGYGSVHKFAMNHWQEVVCCPGQNVGKRHYLRESKEVY